MDKAITKQITFHHKTALQIRFNDIDMMGHVNNAVYQNYLDYAKVKYFNEVLGTDVDWQQAGLVLAKITIDYVNPIFLEEETYVRSRIQRIGNKSLDMYQEVMGMKNNDIKAAGLSVMVGFNFHAQEAIEINQEWRSKISQFEKTSY